MIQDIIDSYEWSRPEVIDWTHVRTFWACPRFSIQSHEMQPIAVRDEAEASIKAEFDRAVLHIQSLGMVRHMWMGEPVRDQVDWMDSRIWYPIRVVYSGKAPAQEPRPYRISPLIHDWGLEDPFNLFVRGLDLMREGNFKDGLELYEYRWQTSQASWKDFEYPHWDGKAKGKILIWAEQGAGDLFHFSRFLKHVDFDCDFVVPHTAHRLMAQSFPDIRVLDGAALDEYDYHLPLCSLPLALGLDMHERYEPYLNAQRRLPNPFIDPKPPPRIGICWAGAGYHLENTLRSSTLEDVIEECPQGTLFSLQKGPARDQLKYLPSYIPVTDLTEELNDWADTAALIQSLDLVVTVDTGVAHLAGAMGKPVRLLLKRSRDFRWGKTGDRTPLYPSMELVRETNEAPHGLPRLSRNQPQAVP